MTERAKQFQTTFSGPPQSKREKILTGALRAFLEYGYNETSMDRVASEAGVSKQTIYSHFKDKERLFHALVEHLSSHLYPSASGDELMALSPAAFLRRVSMLFFEQMDRWEYKAFFRLVVAESGRFPELAQLYVMKGVEPAATRFVEYLRAHPELRIKDPEAVTRVFRGALASHVILQEILHAKHHIPMPRERIIDALVDMTLSLSK